MTNSPLMATSYPIVAFGVAFLVLGLAKLGKAKVNNAGILCWTAGVCGIMFALFLYEAGLPHLVKLLGGSDALGDRLGPLLLKLATVLTIFSMLFILVGFQATGLLGMDIGTTGITALIVGIVTLPYGLVIFGPIKVLGIVLILYSVACIILGLAIKTGKGMAFAASIVVLGCVINILLGLAFQFGIIAI